MCITKEIIEHNDFNAGFFEASLKAYGNAGNYVASPLSVLVLLSTLLTAKGPRGDTGKEICEAVVGWRKKNSCKKGPYTEVEEMLNKIRTGIASARSAGGEKILSISNGAFIRKTVAVEEEFVQKFAAVQGDRVERTFFNSSDAFDSINEWARSATDGIIEKYLKSPDELSSDTLMVLLSAIAFKDNWRKSFEEEWTERRDFFLSKHHRIQVPMMRTEGRMVYFEEDGYRVLAKPFKNLRFNFVIFLPEERFKLRDIEDDLEDGDFKWNKIHNPKYLHEMMLSLPKFKVKRSLDLKPILDFLGIRKLFTRNAADLTGISADAKLYAEKAKQVAVLEVDESGVKAAAVSGFNIMPMSLPPPPIEFTVDQPFYCAIYDSELDMPLFIARIADPRQ
ncbi:hypothetical protein Aperf_G00000029510 [Anoplocephala perfoliata]